MCTFPAAPAATVGPPSRAAQGYCRYGALPMADEVVLVHGWGGSFATTWEASGFSLLLEEAGKQVIGVDLLGHGSAPKPHDPAEYADLTTRIVDAMPDHPVDAIGFSLGAITLLALAVREPHRFSRLLLAAVTRRRAVWTAMPRTGFTTAA